MLELLDKRVREFNKLLRTSHDFIKENKFSEALEYYNLLNKHFNHIPKRNRTKEMSNGLNLVYEELRLYMRINEAYSLAKDGNFSKMNEELTIINDIVHDLKSERSSEIPPLLESTEKYFSFLKEVYNFNISKKSFIEHYNNINSDIKSMDIAKANSEIPKLFYLYNKLSPFISRKEKFELYDMLKSTYKELSIKNLMKKAHMRSFSILYAPEKIERPKHESNIEIPVLNIRSNVKFDKVYRDIRSLIKKDDYFDSFVRYEEQLMDNYLVRELFSEFKRPVIEIPHHDKLLRIPKFKLTDVVFYSKKYDNIHKLIRKGKYVDAVNFYENEIVHNAFPKLLLDEKFSLDKINNPRHEKSLVLPDFKGTESVDYDSAYHKVHSSVSRKNYHKAVEFYEKEINNNKFFKDLADDFNLPKVSNPKHDKFVVLPEFNKIKTADYSEDYEKVHEYLDDEGYAKALRLYESKINHNSFKNILKNKFIIPKIKTPNNKLEHHHFKPQELANIPKDLEKLHNKLEKEIPKAELQIPKIIANHKPQSRDFKVPESVSYSKEFSLVHNKLKNNTYFPKSSIEITNIKLNNYKVSKREIKTQDVVHYSKDFDKIHDDIDSGDYDKALSMLENRKVTHKAVEIKKVKLNAKAPVILDKIPKQIHYSKNYSKINSLLKKGNYEDALKLYEKI
ncbi:hypothetical protein J4476_01260 [Candidatus Woesearchaeota archaeon]|nr:hypothetical protein [Candidatus Woesearchaeota archaeon]